MIKRFIGLLAMCATIAGLGIAGIDPLLASAIGVVELVARVQGNWDPTWNDGDIGISALAAVVLLFLLAASGGIGVLLSRVASLPARRTAWFCVFGTFVVAAIGGANVMGLLSPP